MKISFLLLICVVLQAQVPYQRILKAHSEPGSWLTYSGDYQGHGYSALDQINTGNISGLKVAWIYQTGLTHHFETVPLVFDGIMYITEPPSNVTALDLRTGRPIWTYRRSLPKGITVCCGQVNRGLAALDDQLFLGTVDAHLVALDMRTGRVRWDVEVANYREAYSITVAPLAVKDKVIVGIAGAEYGIRGFLDAYDAKTDNRAWRFWTVPGPGEPGNETWQGDSWKTGGAPTWVTGAYDPESNLVYWGTGNPSPDFAGDDRKGDNLYSDSIVALDADTGKLKWYFQFTPHDVLDMDANQVPVLVDAEFRGRPRKLVLFANRNGFYYVLDRLTGEFLVGKQFARQNWAKVWMNLDVRFSIQRRYRATKERWFTRTTTAPRTGSVPRSALRPVSSIKTFGRRALFSGAPALTPLTSRESYSWEQGGCRFPARNLGERFERLTGAPEKCVGNFECLRRPGAECLPRPVDWFFPAAWKVIFLHSTRPRESYFGAFKLAEQSGRIRSAT